MSELINARNRTMGFRACLLANVSSLALLGWTGMATTVSADEDHPTVWIELGGQFERLDGAPQIFSAPFFDKATPADLAVLVGSQRPPLYSNGFDGKVAFTPNGSDWVFSAAVRYGKANIARQLHHQTSAVPVHFTINHNIDTHTAIRSQFGDAEADSRESHTIVDFQAGKDVGLGLFSAHGSSVVSAGVRFAQFTTSSHATLHARPFYSTGPGFTKPGKYKNAHNEKFEQTYTAVVKSNRNVRIVGPALSWDASMPVVGNGSDMTFNFDWGVNAAVLFGRQLAEVHHQTTGYHYSRHKYGLANFGTHHGGYAHAPADQDRSRTVTIPNVGGFAGATLKFSNIKFSLGYRGDFFFGAMDEGLDTARKTNVGFYGPFAKISFGVGG